jgi:probable rRNA maturation factor
MRGQDRTAGVRGVVFVNLQRCYGVRTASLRGFVRSLKRRLRLKHREFNICFVDDRAIRHMNLAYRGKDKATDVLSFPWNESAALFQRRRRPSFRRGERGGITNFLGDVVISVEMARRNARSEGHSTLLEIRWLILHGVLHLLGYDHEKDGGEMVALELALREQLGIEGRLGVGKKIKRQNAKVNSQRCTESRPWIATEKCVG